MVTYSKLKDGTWGLRSTESLKEGSTVVVAKRDGSSKNEHVGREVGKGQGWALYTISAAATSNAKSRNWRPCGYPGCNQNYCDECDGEGYRAGR
jgi:hypothetical protein